MADRPSITDIIDSMTNSGYGVNDEVQETNVPKKKKKISDVVKEMSDRGYSHNPSAIVVPKSTKPKANEFPSWRTSYDQARERSLGLPQRLVATPSGIQNEPSTTYPVTNSSPIMQLQQVRNAPLVKAISTEQNLKKNVTANSSSGLPSRSAAEANDQSTSLVGVASMALDYQRSFAEGQKLATELQPFQNGDANMTVDEITAYADRAAGLKRDAVYSLAWLENNKSRISEQEYASLKEYYTAQKQDAENLVAVVEWYKNGGSAKVLSNLQHMEQAFTTHKAPISQIADEINSLYAQEEELLGQSATLQREIDALTTNEESVHEDGDEMRQVAAEMGIDLGEMPLADAAKSSYSDNIILLQQQKAAVDQRLASVQAQRDLRLEELGVYWGLAKSHADNDPNSKDIVATGKTRYDAARNQRSKDSKYEPRNDLTGGDAMGAAISNAVMGWRQREEANENNPIAVDIDHMTAEEQDVFYYLIGLGYDTEAVAFANQVNIDNRAKQSEQWSGRIQSWRDILPATVVYSLLFPVAGYDYFANAVSKNMTGLEAAKSIGPAGIRDALVGGSAQYLNQVSGTIGADVPLVGGKGLGDAYQTVVSAAESYASAMAFGPYAIIPLGLSAASSASNDAVARGGTREQATILGLTSGLAEAIFERISIGKFFDGKASGSVMKDISGQFIAEGSEEFFTERANDAADRIIMQEKSNFETSVRQLMENDGMSREDAVLATEKRISNDAAWAFISGGFSGAMMSSVQSVGVYKTTDGIIAQKNSSNPNEQFNYYVTAQAAGVIASDTQATERQKIAQWLKNGANVPAWMLRKATGTYTANNQRNSFSQENSRKSNTQSQASTAQQAQQQTEVRAEQVQAANPDANVITSNGTQVYLNLGFDLKTAQQAGATLDGIVVGEVTSQNMTNTQATSLHLETQIGVEAVKQVLGIQVERTQKGSPARALARNVVQQYEQNKAVATPVSQAQQTAQTMPETAEGQNVEAAQAQEMPQTAQPVQQAQQPVQQPAAEQPRPIPRADAVANTDELSYKDLTAATSSVPTMSAEEITSVETTAAQQQRAKVPDWDTFRRNYVAQNKGASYNDAVAAYQDVLQGNQSGETRQSTKTGTVGLERNDYSDQLDKSVTDGVDSLGKLFGLRIRFADLGARNDNGYYTIGTNDVVLDIAPSRKGIAKENAFRFVIAHEIGHAAKDRLGAESWQQFEDYAVKIMGGEKAITAKQQEGAAYADEAVAREDVACDFIGQLLSDKATLDNFCDAIRSGEVQKETARGFMAAVRKILGKLRGKGIKQFDAVTKQLAEKAAKQFGTELETAENAVKAMQQVLSEAANSKSQNRGLTNKQSFDYTENDIRKSGGGYWYPRLNQSEWDLLKRKLDEGIQSEDGFIDQSTKWLFASEKGTNVFAVYGIGDGSEPTVLYAVGGQSAAKQSSYFQFYIEGGTLDATRKRVVNHIIARSYGKQENRGNDPTVYGDRKTSRRNASILSESLQREERHSRGNSRGTIGRGNEDQSGSSLVKKSLKNTDSNRNPLSAGQQQYFSNSAVRNADGQLKVVYHGTDAEFTVFDFMKAGSKVGRAEGYGFYFTDNPEVAAHYGNSKEYYLNITKPLNGKKKTMSRSDFRKIVSGLLAYDLQEQAADGLTWQDSFLSNYIYTYGMSKANAIRQVADMMFDSNDSDVEMIYELANSDGRNYSPEGIKPLYDVVTRETGYDGIQTTWTDQKSGESSEIYVAFSPEQAKLTNNQNPTNQPDIRFSKKSGHETTAYSERYGSEMQTEGQVERAQARAEQRAAEVKQMNEAAAVVEETKAMVSEALETAEKPKTSERANPLLKPKDTGRADFVEMPKTQLDKEVSKISEEQKEAKEQSKAAPLLKNGKPAANVKPKVNAESIQTAVVDIVQQHGAKTDTASVAEKASELTDAFREAAEIAEDINAESAATYLWDKVDSVAEQVFVEGTLHNSETGKTERYDHTYNHQERKSIVDSIKAKMIEAFAQATSSTKTQKQIDRIVQRMNSQVEKALKAAEAKRVRDLAKQAERAEYKAAQQKSQSKESAAKKIDAIRNRYDAKISDLEQKLKALAKEQRKGSKALETEKRKGAAALSKAERRAEQKAERDRKRIEADYQRQLDRLRKAKDAEIKALTQEVALQVFRRGQAGREAEAALRAWRRDAGIDERIISEEDIKTAIKTAEDLAREAEAKNRKPLGAKAASIVKGAYKAFVSDTFELEQFSRKQSREDNLGTMITAYRNRSGIIDAILDRHLVDPDGNVIDNRSLADVLMVTKNGKPDADAQALLGEYSYHKHGVDRMSIEKRAAENMQRFLKQHPEYDARHGLVATGTLDRATSITEKDGRVRKKSPAQLRPISYKEILTRATNGDTVAQEYIALAKAFSEAKDKPLMGTKDGRSINAATHQAILDNMEASNPWLPKKHAEVMAWWDKFMRAWSVGPFGTLTQYEALMKMYPNYVPTFRVLEKKSGGLRSKNSIDVDSPFQKATGSHLDLRSMEENFAAQVANVVRQARQNDMWHNVRMETIVGDSDISDYARYPGFHNGNAIDYYSFSEDETAPEDQDLKAGNFVEEKGYVKWYGYSNGVREYIEISKDMYDGLLSLMNATKADSVEWLQKATKVGRALSAPLRATATDYSPVFPITNLIKDFQSAIIYGGFGMVPHEFAAAARMLGYEFGDILNIAKKIALKKSSDAENTKFVRFVDAVNAKLQENSRWQTFLDLGGKYSTRSSNEFNLAERRGSFRHSTEYKLGSKPKRAAMIAKQGAGKVASALGALGEFTESVTRFAAFNRYLDKHGDSAESRKAAMKEAAEITVDFSRHGSVGKYLNAITPYLNASIQSIDKFFREVATRKGAERWHLLKRGAIMGTVPTLILMLAVIGLMDDDEEEVYRNLNQRTRDAYYSIPLEDGTAITIPKERQYAQLLGNVIERVVLWATDGDENSQLKDYFSEYLDTSIETNFVPNIPIWDSPIIGTLIDIGRNEDFAGRAIVPAKFNGAAPKDQYDETTSAFAIWMGKTFGVSPMVVDYWITDNFASYGDTFVALTNEAENDGNIWDLFLGSYIQAFSADTAYSSRISEQYYNMRNGLSEKKEGERLHLPEDEYENSFTLEVYRAIEKFNDDITDINDLIKETEDEDEKRALKFAAQKIMEEALDFYERCMNGEIEDPVLYLAYEPYGDAIRDELTRLDEYNGEDYDYTFVPNPQAPKIGDHKNTDEEKAAYVDIYNRHYTEQVGSVMASLEYQNADDEQKLNYLEEARELAYYYSKQEFAQEFGIESETYDPDDATHVYDDLMDAGFTFFEAYEVEQKYKEIRDNKAYQNANVRVTEYNRWIDNHRDWTAVQKKAVRDAYNFTQTQVAEPEKYDALTDTYNLSPDKAAYVVSALSGKDYTDPQRNSKIVSMSGLTNKERYSVLMSYYDSKNDASRRKKIEAAQNAGISAQTYVRVWQDMSALESDKNKNGESIKNSLKNKYAAYLRSATWLTDAQKNLIWAQVSDTEAKSFREDGWRYTYKEY